MKKALFGSLFLTVIIVGGFGIHQSRVGATAACTPPCVGYFGGASTNSYPGDATNILSGGIGANDAASMANILYNYLNFGSYQDQIGAAFVIDHMLGQGSFAGRGGAPAGVAFARSNFGAWQNLVNYYASSPNPAVYGVQWNVFRSRVQPNSAYFFDIRDDAFHNYIAGVDDGPVIRFYWPGGEFLIQRVCANLEGSEPPLAVNHSPSGSITVTCNAATGVQTANVTVGDPDGPTDGFVTLGGWTSGKVGSPGGPIPLPPPPTTDPYNRQVVTLWVRDSGPVGTQGYVFAGNALTAAPCVTFTCGGASVTPTFLDPFMNFSMKVSVSNNVNQTPPGATMSVRITPPVGGTYSFTGTQSAGGSGSTSVNTFTGLGPTGVSGVYNVTWTLSSPTVNKTCTGTFPVVYLPYLNIYGGDVMTGASPTFTSGTSACGPSNVNAGIFSWNNDATNFSGAGTQYAAQALAQIQDFASAQGSSNPPPLGLSFSNNTGVNVSQGNYGGFFGAAPADCDFTSDITSSPTTTDTIINTTTVPTSTRVVQYISGADVFITGSGIRYSGVGGWTAPSQIPYYKLVVVGGNIYIGNGVTQLDGLYVAEPANGRGGTIYTCATGLRSPVNPLISGYYTTCHNQLVVNGSFIAKQVQFLRTAGSLGQASVSDNVSSNHAGEVFNYTPELWLPRGGNTPNAGYTSITGLPPVL